MLLLRAVHDDDYTFLYELLGQRSPSANISHQKMPTYHEHVAFCQSIPYKAWYILVLDNKSIGSIYLTKMNEIGIFVRNGYQGRGIGAKAIDLLQEMHDETRYLANISPANTGSQDFFLAKGFKLIQLTFERRTD